MKITIILSGGGRAGGIKSTVKATNGLLQRGHKVRLLVNQKASLRDRLRGLILKVCYPHSNDRRDLFDENVESFVSSGPMAAGAVYLLFATLGVFEFFCAV